MPELCARDPKDPGYFAILLRAHLQSCLGRTISRRRTGLKWADLHDQLTTSKFVLTFLDQAELFEENDGRYDKTLTAFPSNDAPRPAEL